MPVPVDLLLARVVVEAPGSEYGALVVYAPGPTWEGAAVHLYALDAKGRKRQAYYAEVALHVLDDGAPVYVAVFPRLTPSPYLIERLGRHKAEQQITVSPGRVAEASYIHLPPQPP